LAGVDFVHSNPNHQVQNFVIDGHIEGNITDQWHKWNTRVGSASFYVVPHPIFWLTVPYGLLLCFASALFPTSIPDTIPLGSLARWLGLNYPDLMNKLSLGAAALHVAIEPFYALKLCIEKGIGLRDTILWYISTFIWGVFALWPLAFQDFYLANEATWCSLPLAIC